MKGTFLLAGVTLASLSFVSAQTDLSGIKSYLLGKTEALQAATAE